MKSKPNGRSWMTLSLLAVIVSVTSKVGWDLGQGTSVHAYKTFVRMVASAAGPNSALLKTIMPLPPLPNIPERPSRSRWNEEAAVRLCPTSLHRRVVKTNLPSTARPCGPTEEEMTVYSEALVHMAMLVHDDPEYVAVFSDGGTVASSIVEQILKHQSVERVVLLDTSGNDEHIDQDSDDDDRVVRVMVHMTSSGNLTNIGTFPIQNYIDVVVFDGATAATIHDNAYKEKVLSFLRQHMNRTQGVFVASCPNMSNLFAWVDVLSLEDATTVMFDNDTETVHKNMTITTPLGENSTSQKLLLETLQDYMEPSIVEYPSRFLIGFGNFTSKTEFRSSPTEFEMQLYERMKDEDEDENDVQSDTTDGGAEDDEDEDDDDDDDDGYSLLHIDGRTLQTYHFPPRSSDRAYCAHLLKSGDLSESTKNEYCDSNKGSGFDQDMPNIPFEQLSVKKSSVGENAGRGVFTHVDIPIVGSYIVLELATHYVRVPPESLDIIEEMKNQSKIYDITAGTIISAYMYGYGFTTMPLGSEEVNVDANLLTFVNHGCNGTFNVGMLTNFTEQTEDIEEFLQKSLDDADDEVVASLFHVNEDVYDPFVMRDLSIASATDTIRPIKANSELLDNYLAFIGGSEDLAYDIRGLRKECSGGTGIVEDFQKGLDREALRLEHAI